MTTTHDDSFLGKKLYRSERYRMLGGVCAGIAISRGFSVSLTRLISLLWLATGLGLLLYLILWIVIPTASKASIKEAPTPPSDPLQRDPDNRMIAGICSGTAKALEIDVSIVRIAYVLSILCFGVGVLTYLFAWMLIPVRSSTR